MIKAHNIRHALLGAIVFITIGSFGACSTDPTAPSTDAMTAPTPNAVSSATGDSCQTVDGSTVCTTESATTSDLAPQTCVWKNGTWFCVG